MRFDGDRITRMGVDVVGHPYVDGRAAQVLEWMVNNGALAWDGQEVLFNTPAGVDTSPVDAGFHQRDQSYL